MVNRNWDKTTVGHTCQAENYDKIKNNVSEWTSDEKKNVTKKKEFNDKICTDILMEEHMLLRNTFLQVNNGSSY